MDYFLNPACDIIIWKERIEFLFFRHIVQITGDDLHEFLARIVPLLSAQKGYSQERLMDELSDYNDDDISSFIRELVSQKVVVRKYPLLNGPQDFFGPLDAKVKEDLLLWSTLPLIPPGKPPMISGVGFRLGQQYVLGFWRKKRRSAEATQHIFEWAAGREWLKRGHLLFEPGSDEGVFRARQFIPAQSLHWVKMHLTYLVESQSRREGTYVVDLSNATTHYTPLIERKSQLCITGPFEPVVEAFQQNAYADEPFSRLCSAAVARYRASVHNWKDGAWAWGNNPNPSLAMDIAYAEALERYCAGHYPPKAVRRGRLKDCKDVRINPYSLLNLTSLQLTRKGLKVFTDESPALWIPGVELLSGRKVELLADLCLYPLHHPKGYGPYFWASSSGMAAHRTKEKAFMRALLELLERDAFMAAWLSQASPPHLPTEVLPTEIVRQFESGLKPKGYSLELLDLTRRKIPTVMAIVYRRTWPAFCCGCATRFTFRDAALAAFREAESALFGALQREIARRLISPCEVVLPEDHGCLYYNPKNLGHVKFLWRSKTQSTMKDSVLQDSSGSLEIAALAGVSTLYCVEYPAPTPLLHVVRLDSPDLIPITFGYGLEPQIAGAEENNRCTFPHPLA